MIAHKDEIYSRPKRTWFATEKEKKLVAKVAKVSFNFPWGYYGSMNLCFNFDDEILGWFVDHWS